MKKFLALLLLFGIVGCTTMELGDPRNRPMGLCNDLWNGCTHASHFVKTEYRDLEIISDYKLLTYPKAEAINLKTGEKFHFGNSVSQDVCLNPASNIYTRYCPRSTVVDYCKNVHGSECVLSKFNDETYYTSLDDYNKKEALRIAGIETARKELKKQKESQRLAVIIALKDRCISYGFTGNNNIAACVQREAKHDYEIEQKDYELELARQQIIAQQNQQPVPTEVPWYLSILEAVSEGIAEGYERKALIQSLDARYQRKDIYRYCRPNC